MGNEQEKPSEQSTELQPVDISEDNPFERLKFSHKRFVKAYLENGGNQRQAAITAGYSKDTAVFAGTELMKRPDIAACIKWFYERNGLTVDEVKSQLADIVKNSDIRNFIHVGKNKDGDPAWGITLID